MKPIVDVDAALNTPVGPGFTLLYYTQVFKGFETEVKDLKSKLALAVEALEFYRNPENWQEIKMEIKQGDKTLMRGGIAYAINPKDIEDCSGWNSSYEFAGATAREALAKIKEKENESNT